MTYEGWYYIIGPNNTIGFFAKYSQEEGITDEIYFAVRGVRTWQSFGNLGDEELVIIKLPHIKL